MEVLFNKTFQFLSKVLDYRSERHKLITTNVANMETPEFTAKDLAFPEALRQAAGGSRKLGLAKTHEGHLTAEGVSHGAPGYKIISTGEKPDIDKEMMHVAENNLMFNMTVELLARKFRGLNNVLKETR
jgi:flagellar basal-body rod protein FlgB